MTKLMDFNMWNFSDPIGVGCDAGYGQFDFNFCYVPDVIEENAFAEKSCIEVLNHLIATADKEIPDLEDDLAILKCQLSWADDEKLYEVGCAALREKIISLRRSLQTLRNGYAPDNHALNADSAIHHEPVERIHDIISALLEANIPTESKKESIILKADTEEQNETTAVSASLSRKPDNKQIIGTENQVPDNDIKGESFSLQEAKAVNGSKAIVLYQQNREGKGESFALQEAKGVNGPKAIILYQQDREGKGESFALQEAKAVNGPKAIILYQQDREGKGETEQPTLRALLPRRTKVDFDENETLARLLSSQASKRKKLQSFPTKLKTEITEGSNQTLCTNEISASASNARSQFLTFSDQMKNSSMNSHFTDLQRGTKQSQQETEVSECMRNKLEKMKRCELTATAKIHGLKGYQKLKKSLIVDMIMSKIV